MPRPIRAKSIWHRAGIGSPGHLAGELFKIMAGVNLIHVPYRGEGPALTDAISGQVELMFVSASPSLEFIRAGNCEPLR